MSGMAITHKPNANKLHPTMKPVALVEKALINSSKPQDIVLDLFAGAGSTLIACENLNRIAYLMEIEPYYIDIIIQRWQTVTEQQAILTSNGWTFNELAQQAVLVE